MSIGQIIKQLGELEDQGAVPARYRYSCPRQSRSKTTGLMVPCSQALDFTFKRAVSRELVMQVILGSGWRWHWEELVCASCLERKS